MLSVVAEGTTIGVTVLFIIASVCFVPIYVFVRDSHPRLNTQAGTLVGCL